MASGAELDADERLFTRSSSSRRETISPLCTVSVEPDAHRQALAELQHARGRSESSLLHPEQCDDIGARSQHARADMLRRRSFGGIFSGGREFELQQETAARRASELLRLNSDQTASERATALLQQDDDDDDSEDDDESDDANGVGEANCAGDGMVFSEEDLAALNARVMALEATSKQIEDLVQRRVENRRSQKRGT